MFAEEKLDVRPKRHEETKLAYEKRNEEIIAVAVNVISAVYEKV